MKKPAFLTSWSQRVICVLVLLLIEGQASSLGQAAKTQGTASSCKAFVQEFYDWYSTPIKSDHGRSDRDRYDEDVLRRRPEVLDRSVYRLLKADRDCTNKSKEICKLDFDPFYNSQDPSQKYIVQEVHLTGNRCVAPMMEIREGQLQRTTRVQPELEWRTDHWVFVNFEYFYPDDPSLKPTNLRRILTASSY